METYNTTATSLAVLYLLLTIAVSEPLRVRRDTNATGEELATQRGMLLVLRLINEVGYHLDTFRDSVYGELEQVKAMQEKILTGISDIQTRLNGGSGLPIIPSVHTTTTTPATNSSFIRLVNGSNLLEGRVEVLVGQAWGTVCDLFWESQDAAVVCNMLGFRRENALPLKGASFGMGSGPIIFTGVNCRGSEEDLRLCPMTYNPFAGSCTHSEDAGVICRPLN